MPSEFRTRRAAADAHTSKHFEKVSWKINQKLIEMDTDRLENQIKENRTKLVERDRGRLKENKRIIECRFTKHTRGLKTSDRTKKKEIMLIRIENA